MANNGLTGIAMGVAGVAAFALVFGFGFKAGGEIYDKTTSKLIRSQQAKMYNSRTVFRNPSRY
jgi:hypothetical protein